MSETVTNVVIYARYSSHSQQETSIEGQLKVCYDYCKYHNYYVIEEYIDRALSGKTDNRPAFQKMIADAPQKQFKYIIVYQLDRFSRNRFDSAIYKNKLKKHGIRVLSARENISEDASGILMESVLEGMAEYYSAELSQKIKRGMYIRAEKAQYIGGLVTYGYKVNPDSTYAIDPDAANIVKWVFEQYDNGMTLEDICKELSSKGITNNRNASFKPSTISNMLHNKKYIGVYQYKDIEIPDGIPRIVSDELFYRVATRKSNNARHNTGPEGVPFILTGKLYCGHCRSMMIGYSGTGKSRRYYYYKCKGRDTNICDKKYISKDYIEDIVVQACRELLDPETIDKLVNAILSESQRAYAKSELALLEKQLDNTERKIENVTAAIVDCDSDTVRKRLCTKLNDLEKIRVNIENKISSYTRLHHILDKDMILDYILRLRDGSYDNIHTRKALIDTLINRVYVYDDHFTFIFNSGEHKDIISKSTEDYIEEKTKNCVRSLSNQLPRTLLVEHLFCLKYGFVIVYVI